MIKLSRDILVSLVAPALVCLLVAVQVAYGLRGYDNPLGGVAAVFEVPGMLVGWGSLGFLLPLLGFLVLDWWGVGASGIALKCLGAAALALALGGVFGVLGGVASGGHLGGSLAELLGSTLGTVPAMLLLALMAVPGAVLTFAGFREIAAALTSGEREARAHIAKRTRAKRKASPEAGSARKATGSEGSALSRIGKKVRSSFRSTRKVSDLTDLVRTDGMEARVSEKAASPERRYPERRYDAQGNEMPMDLVGARDVGTIRFTHEPDVPESSGTSAVADAADPSSMTSEDLSSNAPETPAEFPTIPQLFGDPDVALPDSPESSGDTAGQDSISPQGSHAARAEGVARQASEAVTDRSLGRVVGLRSEQRAEVLPAGVRWADAAPIPTRPKYAESEAADPEDVLARQAEAVSARFDRVQANPTGTREDEDAEITAANLPASARALGDQLSLRSTPADGESQDATTASVRDSVLQALGEAKNDSNRRYQEKLAASGIFDFMDAAPASTAKPALAAKRALPKRGASKKASASKKAPASKPSKPKAVSSKAAKLKGGPASAKKAATKKKAPAKKTASKPAAKKAATKKTATKKTAKKPAAEKPATKKAATKKAAPKKPASKKTPPARDSDSAKRDALERGPRSGSGGGSGGRGSSRTPSPKTAAARVKPPRQTGTTTEIPSEGERPWRGGAWHARGALTTRAGIAQLDDAQRTAIRQARLDPTFQRAAALVVGRGAGSPVLLTRRLGLDYPRARDLVHEMVNLGVLAEAGARGGHAARFSPATWAALDRA